MPSPTLNELAARGCEVIFRCFKCPDYKSESPAVLARRFGGHTTLEELGRIVGCRICKRAPDGENAELFVDSTRSYYREFDVKMGRKPRGGF